MAKAKRLRVKSKDSAATPILSRRSPRFKPPTSPQSHLNRPKLSHGLNAKRLRVKSKDSAATPILSRRSPRFNPPTPPQSHLTSSSARPKLSHSTNKPGLPPKKSRSPHACENVVEKDTLLASLSVPRRSPRLTKIGTSGIKHDVSVTKLGVGEKNCPQSACKIGSDKVTGFGTLKNQRKLLRSAEAGTTNNEQRRSPRLAKIGCEEKPNPQSVCEIASDKFAALVPVKNQRRLPKSAKVCTTNMPRRSPRLVSTDITSNNFSVEITKNSTRSCKSNKSGSSGPSVHQPYVSNKAIKSKCTKESSNNCSKGRRKSHRFTVPSDKLKEPNCSQEGEIGHISQQCQPSICENASEKVAKLTCKPPLPPQNQRRSKRTGNQSEEITRKDSKSKYVEASDSDYESEKSPLGKKRKREESAETEAPDVFANGGLHDGLDGWTEEQERALHKAYLLARPTPHFWKKVSKMVPGKNAQECFNRIQSNFTTPPSIPPKTRLNKCRIDSPLKKFNLLDPSTPKDHISAEHKTRRVSKQKKTRDARKTLRHLLKKQKLVDQVQGADYFSQFEASPIILPSDVKLPSDFSCKVRLNSGLENNLRPGPSQSQPEPSPVVLKQVKNMELHEKYIDHLHCVDARRKACVRACSSKGKDVDLGTQAGVVMDAKTALVSEAQDFIGCFKKLQADPFGDCALSEDDDEDVL